MAQEYGVWGRRPEQVCTIACQVFNGSWSASARNARGEEIASSGGHQSEVAARSRLTVRLALFGYRVLRPAGRHRIVKAGREWAIYAPRSTRVVETTPTKRRALVRVAQLDRELEHVNRQRMGIRFAY